MLRATPDDDDRRVRLAAVHEAAGVLKALGDASAVSALEIRRSLQEEREPDGKLVRTVETALLVAIMSPKVRDEDDLLTNGRGLLGTASGLFRDPPPTRQNVRRAYRAFEAAFRRRLPRA
jgi:hypothetical protein